MLNKQHRGFRHSLKHAALTRLKKRLHSTPQPLVIISLIHVDLIPTSV